MLTKEKMCNKKIGGVINLILILVLNCSYDVFLRILTREINYMNLYASVPNLFTIAWSLILVALILLLPEKIGKICFGIIQGILCVYTLGQYIYYKIFESFFRISDILAAKEGAEFSSVIGEYIDIWMILYVIFFLFLIVVIYKNWRNLLGLKKNARVLLSVVCVGLGVILIQYLPVRLGTAIGNEEELGFEVFMSSRYMYETLSTPTYALQTVGELEYFFRDIYLTINKRENVDLTDEELAEEKRKVEDYFSQRGNLANNFMTGYFKGKNLILIQMESIDDWIISEKYTPTIKKLMEEGINFTNFYTPYFGTGYTINTEFVVNTGLFPYSNSMIAYGIPLKGEHTNAIGNIFSDYGYDTKSFHMNSPAFYKRGELHRNLGYQSYHHADKENSKRAEYDSEFLYLKETQDNIMENMPFLNFVISYSAHLPYNYDGEMTKKILKENPELKDSELSEEKNSLCIKAYETDKMFANLIEMLKEKNQLQNTVIIAYTDHYAYGVKDTEALQKVSGENVRLEKTPFFIWSSDIDKMKVDKICSSVDVLPTISNLFGVGDKNNYLGRDIFDEDYEGLAYFKDYSYEYNGKKSSEEIEREIADRIILNQYILDLYYSESRK